MTKLRSRKFQTITVEGPFFAPLFCTVIGRPTSKKGTFTDFRKKNDKNFGLHVCLFYLSHFSKKREEILH